jgi:ABC-type Fe3+/spermidine/putrescine transport system ATPase subunit
MRLVPLGAPTPPTGSDNALERTVRDIVYTGSDTQYFVDLGAATTVMVRVPNDHAPGIKAPVARGDLVCVCWDPESAAVLVA